MDMPSRGGRGRGGGGGEQDPLGAVGHVVEQRAERLVEELASGQGGEAQEQTHDFAYQALPG